jgi:hypothetical protein
MSSPTDRKIKQIKKAKTKSHKATAAHVEEKSSGKAGELSRKKQKTSSDEIQETFGFSAYLDSTANEALASAECTGRVLRAIGAGLDDAGTKFNSPDQQEDKAEYHKLVKGICEYINCAIKFRNDFGIDTSMSDPALPESVPLPESQDGTSEDSSENSASEGSSDSEDDSGSEGSGGSEGDSGSESSESSEGDSSSESESGSDVEMMDAQEELPTVPIQTHQPAKVSERNTKQKANKQQVTKFAQPDQPTKASEHLTKHQPAKIAQLAAKEPLIATLSPATFYSAPETLPAQKVTQAASKVSQPAQKTPGIATMTSEDIYSAVLGLPVVKPKVSQSAPTEPVIAKRSGAEIVHARFNGPPVIQVSKEPVKKSKPVKITGPPIIQVSKEHVKKSKTVKIPGQPVIQVSKEPVKKATKPAAKVSKAGTKDTNPAAQVSQPVRHSETPIPLPKFVQLPMKTSQPSATKPSQPAAEKSKTAAKVSQPSVKKILPKKKEMATTCARKTIPKSESSSSYGEDELLEYEKPMSLPTQPKNVAKSRYTIFPESSDEETAAGDS